MFTVCIDPGHGDKDPGAVGKMLTNERDINLKVGLKVAQRLSDNDVKVVLTRKTNNPGFTGIHRDNLQHRCDIANDSKADIFVSIHCDSFHNRSAKGTTTYVYKKNTSSDKLGNKIHNNLISLNNLKSRGIKTANYYVLRKTHMPAVLVELAYISNPKEEQLLNTDEFQCRCADGITKGILEFLGVKNMDKPSSWAKEIWSWGKANKLTDGTRPQNNMTREEVMALLHSYHYKNKRGQIK